MKQDPQEAKIVERMAAGVFCREGFLGDDLRPLGEILDADQSTLAGLGVTDAQLAERLGEVLLRAMSALGREAAIDDERSAVYFEAMGRIPCPFGDGVYAKGEAQLTDAASGKGILFTPLSVHMIAEHGFYQGRGSRYRFEPEELAEALRVSP